MKIITTAHDLRLPENVRYNRYDDRLRSDGRIEYNVTLKPVGPGKYSRRGFTGRRIAAVCYHGHYDFMAYVYDRDPDAVIKSSMATYNGEDDFYANATMTAGRNIGSAMQPLYFEDACDCYREGTA